MNAEDVDAATLVVGEWPSEARVGIVVPTYRRAEYLTRCLESLGQSDLSGCILCIVDESDAAPPSDPDGFTALRGVDSPDHDLGQLHADVSELAAHARREGILAFNDAGWLKHDLLAPQLLNTDVGYGFRLFVSDEYLARHPEYRAFRADPPADASGAGGLVAAWEGSVPTVKISKRVHQGVHDSLMVGWDALLEHSRCRYLCNLDADMVVKPNWITELTRLHDDLGAVAHHPLICSGFNAVKHEAHGGGTGFLLKRTVGGANLLFEPGVYRTVVRDQLRNVAWDWRLCAQMEQEEGTFAVTSPSVVQHIGVLGMWSDPESFDQADDF